MLEKTEREIKNGQSRDTGNIGYTRHMTKTNKSHTHTSQKTKTRSNTNPTKNRWWKICLQFEQCTNLILPFVLYMGITHFCMGFFLSTIKYSSCANFIVCDYYWCDII